MKQKNMAGWRDEAYKNDKIGMNTCRWVGWWDEAEKSDRKWDCRIRMNTCRWVGMVE